MKARFFESPAEWRAWLEKNHAAEPEIVVGFHKRGTGKPSLTWPESVDEALCFGWIDGVRRRIDDEAYQIRFTPRKKSSTWSAVNVKRVAVLDDEGRMTAAGRAAFAARKAEKTAIYSHEQTRASVVLSGAHLKRLRANEKAWADWSARPPWYQRAAAWYVVSAKKEETREKRFELLLERSALGEPIGPLKRE